MTHRIMITNSELNINKNDIQDFEKNYNLILPENYKKFLLKYNGGQVDDDRCEDVQSFYSLKYGELTIDYVFENYCIIEPLLDKDYLPIGNSYGNPITLCLKVGKDYGKVIIFYFDRDEEPVVIADSLEVLLGVKSMDEL